MDAITYINYFKTTAAWRDMSTTVEDSPWHREASVAVHTEMVIEQYLTNFAADRTDRQNKIALLALLFHDVGKPEAEEVLDRKDGAGTYRRYAGHEQYSAIAFTEFWLQDPALREFVSVDEARQIRWIIEHHLPYGYKDGKKRSDLRTAMEHTLREDVQTFYDCLRSDCWGRISDDHDTKKQNVEDWIREFRTVPLTINRVDSSMGTCFVMIGPSGSGKSTWTQRYLRACDKVLSMYTMRHEFWFTRNSVGFAQPDDKEFYRAIFAFAMENEKDFNAYMEQRISETMRTLKIAKGNLYIDNVHASKKARAKWIQAARNIGMKVVAVEFWNTLGTVLDRQDTRTDKQVPYNSVSKQYWSQTSAWLGSEVDEVIVVPGT